MTQEEAEVMNDVTVYEARMLAVEGMCMITGNGQLYAIVEDSKGIREKWEKRRCADGY